jgi:quinol-cytochrome oxidoreductase complex cytochrome b subunit
MRRVGRGFKVLAAGIAVLAGAVPAHAGMPSYTLTDLAKARLDTISFFLVLVLVLALLVKFLWNYLARDFSKLPRMSYPKALAAVTLWGLLFLLVLTMISGARELMTPGAWEKQGATYKLKDDGK